MTTTTRTIEFTCPFPPSRLRPNGSRDWRERHALGKEYAQTVAWAIREALGPPPYPRFERVRMQITAVYPNRRGVWDDDAITAAWKGSRDVLTDPVTYKRLPKHPPPRLGLVHDDSPKHFEAEPPATVICGTSKDKYLVVRLEEVGR